MIKNILNLTGVQQINRKQQKNINGSGGCSASLCTADGGCPAGSTCEDGICECDSTGGGGSGGGSCNEPTRFCLPGETGCGCVYV